jgi:receptor expression-enhancing protein 5/6
MSKLLNVNPDLKSSSPDIKLADEFVKKYIDEEDISLIEKINKQLKNNRRFYKISIKLHIQPFYLLLILLTPVLILLLTFFSFTTKIITTFYPLYMSMKTLQYQVGKRTEDGRLYRQVDEDNDTTKWLSYWLLYSFIINTECLLQSLVDKIPLYKLIKFLILLSCFIPQIEFNVIIYNYFTRKIFILYGEKFEKMKIENLFMDNKEEEIIEKPLKQEDSNTPTGESFSQRKKLE